MKKEIVGIEELYNKIIKPQIEEDIRKAEKIFLLVTEEKATQSNLEELVTPSSLFQLILFSVDFSKRMRAIANQASSKKNAALSKEIAEDKLEIWLNANLKKYKGKLESCADMAMLEIPNLGRGFSWVRKQITLYIKHNKPFSNSPSASSLRKK